MARGLFDDLPDDPPPPTTRERFLRYHAEHPEVYELFKGFVGELVRAGHQRYGTNAIINRIRWHFAVSGGGGADFKINDHFAPHYSRMLVAEHPALTDFFEFRALRAP